LGKQEEIDSCTSRYLLDEVNYYSYIENYAEIHGDFKLLIVQFGNKLNDLHDLERFILICNYLPKIYDL